MVRFNGQGVSGTGYDAFKTALCLRLSNTNISEYYLLQEQDFLHIRLSVRHGSRLFLSNEIAADFIWDLIRKYSNPLLRDKTHWNIADKRHNSKIPTFRFLESSVQDLKPGVISLDTTILISMRNDGYAPRKYDICNTQTA